MGYRRSILTNWSRRDRLAVLVVGVTVAFLTGTALLILAVSSQTTALAAELQSPGVVTHYDSVESAQAAASPHAIVLPTAQVRTSNGTTTVVGVPNQGTQQALLSKLGVKPPDHTTKAGISKKQSIRLQGQHQAVELEVYPQSKKSIFPPSWYVTNTKTVNRLGATGAITITPTSIADSTSGTPLLSALAFFVAGTKQALSILTIIAAGGAILVAVSVYSVTSMSVKDRLDTIRVIRATGGTPRTVVGLFALRAGLLCLTGLAVGYAGGLIIPRAAVNLAVTAGAPTSLSIHVTNTAGTVLIPIFIGIFLVGCLAGAAAAWPAVRTVPAQIFGTTVSREFGDTGSDSSLSSFKSLLQPDLLNWRALVPTTATLTAFIAFIILVSSIGTAVSPLMASKDTTITQPGSPHPIASKVPEQYASVLHSHNINASPEILLFEMSNGDPFIARGVNYSAFASVTDASILRGRRPTSTNEAVLGANLAHTLNLGVGDTITLGGSTHPAVSRVRIVGIYRASGSFDDELLVTLPMARHLAGIRQGEVQFIRADRLPQQTNSAPQVSVARIDAPKQVAANHPLKIRVRLRNYGLRKQTRSYTVRYGKQTRQVTKTIPGGKTRTVTVQFNAGSAGNRSLKVANQTKSVQVVSPGHLSVEGFPSRAPPHSRPQIHVVNATGGSVSNVTVSIGDQTVTTNKHGRVRVPIPGSGTYRLTLKHGQQSLTRHVLVTQSATRNISASVSVTPNESSIMVQPKVKLIVLNPWNKPISGPITIDGPGGPYKHHVSLKPGSRKVIKTKLPRRQPGKYTVRVQNGSDVISKANYTVTGDSRVVSALASSGYSGTSGIGQAVAMVFGNLYLVFGSLLVLASLMTIGGTTATFAQAVHARRRTIGIHRTTGSAPSRILWQVFSDAIRIGAVATLAALVIAVSVLWVLSDLNYLTVLGMRISINPNPLLIVGTIIGGVLLTLIGSLLATIQLIASPPAELLSGDYITHSGDEIYD